MLSRTLSPRISLVRSAVVVAVGAALVALLAPEVEAGLGAWTSGGPEGGPVIALAVDPQTPSVVYAGAQFGGVFKTATGGSFWTPIDNGLASPQVHALAIDPKTPSVVYAGTALGGVFKTTTGGVSWFASNSGLPFPSGNDFVYAIAIDPSTPTTLYIGTASGSVFKSTNGGASWSVSLVSFATNSRQVFSLAIDPTAPSTVYAGTLGSGVFKTTNGGANWSMATTGLGNLTIEAIVIDSKTPSTIYAGTFGGGVFKSVNGAGSWSASNVGLADTFVQRLAIDPNTPLTLYAGTSASGVFKSTNGGASWSPSNNGLPSSSVITGLTVDPVSPTTIYAAPYGGGVFKSTDGGNSWVPRNASLTASFTVALSVDARNPATIYAGTHKAGLFKSDDGGGSSWRPSGDGITDPTVNAVAVSPASSATIYAATSQASVFLNLSGPGAGAGGVFKSTNGGASWTRSLSTPAAQTLVIDPVNPSTVYVGTLGAGVFKTTDGGATWNSANTGLPVSALVLSLAIDPSTPAILYAGTSGTSGERVFKTTNGGATWSNTGLSSSQPVTALAMQPQTPSTVFAGTFDGIFKTTNGGATWTDVTAGLSNQDGSRITIFSLVFDPQTPTTLYAGSFDNGVFKTTNGGGSWNQSNNGLPADAVVHALAVNPAGTCLHAGTGGGVYDFASAVDSQCPPPPTLAAALAPTSLLVEVNVEARTFASIANVGSPASPSVATRVAGILSPGVTCGITQLTGEPTPFTFQAIDLTTSAPIAPPNTPVGIIAGSNQGFLITLVPKAAICAREVKFGYNCANAGLAPIIVGVNTLLLTATGSGQCAGVRASAGVNQAIFSAGETVSVTIGGSNPGANVMADVYVGAFLPDGNTVVFVTSTGAFDVGSGINSLRPYRAGLQLQSALSITIPNFVTYRWTGGEPRGDYVLFLLVMKAGAAPTLSGDQVLGRATAPFSLR